MPKYSIRTIETRHQDIHYEVEASSKEEAESIVLAYDWKRAKEVSNDGGEILDMDIIETSKIE
jgi:hypothetical protein